MKLLTKTWFNTSMGLQVLKKEKNCQCKQIFPIKECILNILKITIISISLIFSEYSLCLWDGIAKIDVHV